MKEKTAAEVLTDIYQMQYANQPVQQNRARINALFNGDPPWTEQERQANKIFTNVNWLEGSRIAQNSRYQLNNAFFKPGNFFDGRLQIGPIEKRAEWSRIISKAINKILTRSNDFKCALESAFAQTVLHGPGPLVWKNRRTPIPSELGVEDVLLPAGTFASMRNLDRLSIYREWTWFELEEMISGDSVDPGWNKEYVKLVIDNLKKQPLQPIYQGNRWLFPEKLEEDYKEGSSTLASSALPKVLVWDYYFRGSSSEKWNRRIILDYGSMSKEFQDGLQRDKKNPEFLYTKDNYADSWQHIIHWFIGNCSNVAPFRYYSIRSIGYLLYGVCLIQNRLRCRFTDSILESLLWYFRNVSEDDRERLEKVDLHHMGIIPDGLSFVPQNERNVIDEALVMAGLNQGRQLMAESASSFLPDVATEGEQPAMTATESLIRQNASITLTSAVLNQTYNQSEPLYREICRRFFLKDNDDELVKKFRKEITSQGVPLEVLDIEQWEVIPNRVMGGGNKSVELTTSQALMEMAPGLDPEAQRIIKRKRVLALTDDPGEAELLVPEAGPVATNATHYANALFGTLMTGSPELAPRRDISELEYIGAMLQLMENAMQQVPTLMQRPESLPNAAEKLVGLFNVGANIDQHIQILASDELMKVPVKLFAEKLNELMNINRATAQEIEQLEAESAQAQGGVSPEVAAKIENDRAIAQNKMHIDQAKAQLKQQQKDIQFEAENRRKDAQVIADVQRNMAKTEAEIKAKDLETAASIERTQREPVTA